MRIPSLGRKGWAQNAVYWLIRGCNDDFWCARYKECVSNGLETMKVGNSWTKTTGVSAANQGVSPANQGVSAACWAEQKSSVVQVGTCVLVAVTVLFLFCYSAEASWRCK